MRNPFISPAGYPIRGSGGGYRSVVRWPLTAALTTAVVLLPHGAHAQLASSNVPLPNVLLLLDTSGSMEQMIDGSLPEAAANNPSASGTYADCMLGLQASIAGGQGLTAPNKWALEMQALTGNVQPYYSCVNMDRTKHAFVEQYGIRMGATDLSLQVPYDYGYYLPYHRPVAVQGGSTLGAASLCVYTPYALPGAPGGGGVGTFLLGIPTGGSTTPGATGPTDCFGTSCLPTDFPGDAIGQFLFDGQALTLPGTVNTGVTFPINPLTPGRTTNMVSPVNTTCSFQQDNTGIITAEGSLLRFGLMTYDNDTEAGTGVQGAPQIIANTPTSSLDPNSPFPGNWSYFKNWQNWLVGSPPTGGTPDVGKPAQCTTSPTPVFEVGARNPAAPPWEGRLIGFPNPTADSVATVQWNTQLETAIRALRPYGATPTAGLFSDAEYYLWQDPSGPGQTDDFIKGGCRQQNIILLTDGAPNLDLRPSCAAAGSPPGICPYALAEDTAAALYTGTDSNINSPYSGSSSGWTTPMATGAQVLTYVIGFAVADQTTGLPVNCQNLAETGQLPSMCGAPTMAGTNPPTTAPSATDYSSPCCSLQRIAVAGGTGRAYFADTPGDLNAALAAVIGQIAGQLASQTLPSYSPSVTYAAGTNAGTSSAFFSSFDGQAVPWTGDVQRQQDVCVANIPVPQNISGSPPLPTAPTSLGCTMGNGDDFECDLQTQSVHQSRNFMAFTASQNTRGDTQSAGNYTIRPYLGNATVQLNGSGGAVDGLGTFGSTGGSAEIWASGPSALTTLAAAFPANSLNIQPGACQDPQPPYAVLTQNDCANVALSFGIAAPTVSTPSDPNFAANIYSGAVLGLPGANRNAAPFGAVLHSTPLVDTAPAALIRDDSYQAFALALSPKTLSATAGGARDTMLYVSTGDGLLHAFDTSFNPTTSTGLPGVEAWAFMPPGIMTGLIGDYPAANKILADGAPRVKDVVFTRSIPQGTVNWINDWHTMLVAGFGAGGRGYFALDVTDPRPNSTPPSNFSSYPTTAAGLTGPHFQWQFASVNAPANTSVFPSQRLNATTELLGTSSATPAIATVYIQPKAGAGFEEVGVAILPGGSSGVPVAGTCQRELATGTTGQYSGYAYPARSAPLTDPNFGVRTYVRQWAGSTPGLCHGTGTNVPGRNLTIVSVATGEVIALFARPKPSDYLVTDATTWDVPTDMTGSPTVSHTLPGTGSGFLIPTPFDSPVTGTPVVYPSEVGAIAQHIYVGDADGTLWRIDVTNKDPAQWTAAIMADGFYGASETGDVAGLTSYGGTAPSNWTSGLSAVQNQAYDSQPITVAPVIALDTQGTVTVAFATGDQTSLTTTYTIPGTKTTNPVSNFVYSVADTVDAVSGGASKPTATVRWYMPYLNGERVTGPMAIFNNTLYYATFLPPQNVPTACINSGIPSLWGLDFVHPIATCGAPGAGIGCGGNPLDYLTAAVPCAASSQSAWGQCEAPQDANGNASFGDVIPGVTVAVAPSCATVSNPVVDPYTGGMHVAATGGNTGTTYSLVAQVKGTNHHTTGVNTVTTKLKTPISATIVDSWAAVVE